MKRAYFILGLFAIATLALCLFSAAQIYNEDYSKSQKLDLFKENRVWMVYGWTYFYPKGVQEKKGKKTSFERFDRPGNRTEEIYYDAKGNTSFSCQYIYNEMDVEIKKMGGVGDEVIYDKWMYTRLSKGKQLEKKSIYKKSKEQRWVYEFDVHKNIVTETYYDITGMQSYKWVFAYDADNHVTEKKEYDGYGNVYQRWKYGYDEKGNNDEMHYYVSNNKLQSIYQMKYDKKGNMKSKFTLDAEENIENLTIFVYQFYDGSHAPRGLGNK